MDVTQIPHTENEWELKIPFSGLFLIRMVETKCRFNMDRDMMNSAGKYKAWYNFANSYLFGPWRNLGPEVSMVDETAKSSVEVLRWCQKTVSLTYGRHNFIWTITTIRIFWRPVWRILKRGVAWFTSSPKEIFGTQTQSLRRVTPFRP